MTRPLRMGIFVALAAAAAFAQAPSAGAQTYPTHPITMIVPFAAGGPADVVGRILAKHLSAKLPIIVENIGGAGGNLGSAHVARSAPDGYTVLFQNISMAISPALYPKLDYDPIKDFDDLGLVAYQPNVVLTGPKFPATTFAEFVSMLRANQAKLSFANTGTGGASYLCAVLFMNALKLDITSVPYRGTSQAMTDLLGGQVDLLCDSVATATPYIKAGSVKAFGVTSTERFSQLPDVPTLAEQGMTGFDMVNWTALYAPKGTPPAILTELRNKLHDVVTDPNFLADLKNVGSAPVSADRANADAHARYLTAEMQRWAVVLKGVTVPSP
jgi:tripartite-type tricarboxylate transporter receptor subunit TctC